MSTKNQLFNAQSGFAEISQQFEQLSLEDVLRWSLWTFSEKVAQVTSFGPAGMVILDHLARLNPGMRVITIDTSFFFPETYDLWQQIQQRYNIHLDVRRSPINPLAQAQQYGHRLWEGDPDRCCHIRKVIPLRETLRDVDAWITGVRRDQSATRATTPILAWDHKHELVKISPLAHWTRTRVWQYIHQHKLPYNQLHDQGYASIGCAQCTQPAANPHDERAGRWQGRTKTECGIHIQ